MAPPPQLVPPTTAAKPAVIDHRRAGDGLYVAGDLLLDTEFAEAVPGFRWSLIRSAGARGVQPVSDLAEFGPWQGTLQVGPDQPAYVARGLVAGEAYRLVLEITSRVERRANYVNIFGLPISPETPWQHRYENMDVSHQLPAERYRIEVEFVREHAGWDVSYSLDGVPMHRGLYDLASPDDLVLYAQGSRAEIHRLRLLALEPAIATQPPDGF